MTVSDEVRERMLQAWRPRVLKAARRLIGRAKEWMELDDLVSVGSLALDKAITQFDPNRGTKFEVFASSRIRFAMLKEIERVSCPEISVSNYAHRDYLQMTDEPGPRDNLDFSENVVDCGECERRSESANGRQVIDTGLEARTVNRQFWRKVFEECLTIRERKIIRCIIWDRMTRDEVGQELGLSREWVSGVYQNSLTKLKEYLTEHGLDANTIIG